MSKHHLVIVCALAFTVGGVSAGVLYNPPGEGAAVRRVAAHNPDAGHAVGGVKKTGAGLKKTGAAIGRTFGKIGGVFHD